MLWLERVKQLGRLSQREQALFFRIALLTACIRLALLVLPFRWLTGFLGDPACESAEQEERQACAAAREIGQMIDRVSRHMPWESKCLVQAMAGQWLLTRRQVDTTLYLGLARTAEGRMLAHAWLRCGAWIVTGQPGQALFTVVGKFGSCCTIGRGKGGEAHG